MTLKTLEVSVARMIPSFTALDPDMKIPAPTGPLSSSWEPFQIQI